MPRQRRESSSRSSLPCSPNPARTLPRDPLEDEVNVWEYARCPVCMEHPHNAILLMCSSHEKGCRPYMCDTSYRHSNCFDQFKNSFGEVSSVLQRPEDLANLTPTLNLSTDVLEQVVSDSECERSPERPMPVLTAPYENAAKSKLACPLCRGVMEGCKVVNNARRFMNEKSRSCACETCDFNGTYADLRKHARSMHPFVRPTETDPERERDWRRLERERDLGDLHSMIQSLFGGDETTEDSTLNIGDGGWLTVFFIVRLIRPGNGNSSTRSRTARARGQEAVGRRSSRRFWGEALDGDSDSRNGGGDVEDSESSWVGNVRRRTRSDYRNGSGDVEDSESSWVRNVRRRTRSDYRDGGGHDENSERSWAMRRTRSDYRDGGGHDENSERSWAMRRCRRRRSNPEEDNNEASGSRDGFPGQQ